MPTGGVPSPIAGPTPTGITDFFSGISKSITDTMATAKANWNGTGGMQGGTFDVAKNKNPDYNVHIKCAAAGFEIIADLPEQTNFSVVSDYEAVLAGIGDSSNNAANLASYMVGTSVNAAFQSTQIWKASSPIDLMLTILFDATSNAHMEVYRPMRLLEALVLPKSLGAGGIVVAPNQNMPTTLTIGRQLTLPEVLMISVNNTFDTRLDKDGFPISGQSEVNFRTVKAYSREEWISFVGI